AEKGEGIGSGEFGLLRGDAVDDHFVLGSQAGGGLEEKDGVYPDVGDVSATGGLQRVVFVAPLSFDALPCGGLGFPRRRGEQKRENAADDRRDCSLCERCLIEEPLQPPRVVIEKSYPVVDVFRGDPIVESGLVIKGADYGSGCLCESGGAFVELRVRCA